VRDRHPCPGFRKLRTALSDRGGAVLEFCRFSSNAAGAGRYLDCVDKTLPHERTCGWGAYRVGCAVVRANDTGQRFGYALRVSLCRVGQYSETTGTSRAVLSSAQVEHRHQLRIVAGLTRSQDHNDSLGGPGGRT